MGTCNAFIYTLYIYPSIYIICAKFTATSTALNLTRKAFRKVSKHNAVWTLASGCRHMLCCPILWTWACTYTYTDIHMYVHYMMYICKRLYMSDNIFRFIRILLTLDQVLQSSSEPSKSQLPKLQYTERNSAVTNTYTMCKS